MAIAKKKAAPKKAVAKKAAAKKPVAKKATVKKTPAKKAAVKKAAVKKAPAKVAAPKVVKDKLSKSQILTIIADTTDLARKDVSAVLDQLEVLIAASVKKGALGEFTVPGLMKIITVKKPAKKARKGINPFTGAEQMFKAKPASIAVKVRPLKKLKEYAGS